MENIHVYTFIDCIIDFCIKCHKLNISDCTFFYPIALKYI